VANSPQGQKPNVKLQFRIANVLAGDAIAVKVNGSQLPTGEWDKPPPKEPATRWFRAQPDRATIKAGTNRVEIRLVGESSADRPTANLVALTMPVRYE
jgi:hypothetical protein